jgi:hypothetical protein
MSTRRRWRHQGGQVVAAVPETMGAPAASDDWAKGALRRWRQQRQLRRADALERKIAARENLRDFKPYTGGEGGPAL